MNGWRYIDYLVHHTPFVVVVGGGLALGMPTEAFKYTLALDLLTSLNEAVAAMRALGAPKWIDIPNRFYLLTLMCTLVVFELYELLTVLLVTRQQHTASTLVVTVLGLAAPAYHAFGVLPHCWKVVKGYVNQQLGGAEHVKAQ